MHGELQFFMSKVSLLYESGFLTENLIAVESMLSL